jgi:hypothetical protein
MGNMVPILVNIVTFEGEVKVVELVSPEGIRFRCSIIGSGGE